MLMIRNPKWLYGFLAGTMHLLWSIVLLSLLARYLTVGPALLLLYLTLIIFLLMILLMLLFVFFRQTRPISFGLAIPLLVSQIGLAVLTWNAFRGPWWGPWAALLVNVPTCAALLTVGIIYLRNTHNSGGQGAIA